MKTSLISLAATWLLVSSGPAGDWPMWRYDASRGSSSPDALPEEMQLQWTRQLPPPAPAWPVEQAKLQFDLQAEPVVMGERLFVPSSKNDRVTAYSTRSGEELWRFYADAPVRFAPVAHEGRVFFNADDGFLYALDAASGELIWKVNGGPGRRLILGNDRLISSWPARGGVVLHDGKLFFATSIWSFMGIFVHAVTPETGEIVWSNSGDGTNWTVQPHSAPSFSGVVPQGHLAAAGTSLVVPGGRSTPAVFDTSDGEQRFFHFDKRNGGHDVGAVGELIFCASHAYTMANGSGVGGGAPAIFDREMLVAADPESILVREVKAEIERKETVDRKGKKVVESTPKYREQSKTKLTEPVPGRWRIRAGPRFYAAGAGAVAAYESGNPEPVWEAALEGEPYTVLAADDRLFVLTREGLLHCFGAGGTLAVRHHAPEVVPLTRPGDEWADRAGEILERSGVSSGYALVLGLASGRLVEELLAQSDLHVIAVDPDKGKIESLRRRLDEAGVYGARAAAFAGDPATEPFPPYFCSLITSEAPGRVEGLVENAWRALRPYGGVACFETAGAAGAAAFANPEATVEKSGQFTLVRREGALPDSDDWTHQYANAAQTVVSRDARVKAPFGVLWFGGPSHEGILPRHGHGPSPQVAGGRLFIEGADLLRAVDVYTGRLLWEKELPGFGQYYDVTAHFAGAGEIGSNYVSLPDRVYAVYGDAILELDAEDGETLNELRLPGERAPYFGYVSVSGDHLVATSTPVGVEDDKKSGSSGGGKLPAGATALIPPRAEWRYLAGEDAIEGWTEPGYDDREWKSGKAGFGYGDSDDETELDMRNKFGRVYLRKTFEAGDEAPLTLRISYDDAFIAYLNGREILRRGVGKGRGAGAEDIKSHEAGKFELFELEGVALRAGTNVLAIEGHNSGLTSSDFTLDPVLLVRNGASALASKAARPEPAPEPAVPTTRYASGSRRLVVYDRHSGELLWEREARHNFRHNNIAVAEDRIFCIDAMTDERSSMLARRGIRLEGDAVLYALDLKTGAVLWQNDKDVFGTFLNYSAEHDVLLQASSRYRDRASDEAGKGMMALRGATGEVLWHDEKIEFGGPCLLWRDKIFTNGAGGFEIELMNGEKTGWDYARMYGCNTAVGSEHLLTFRSGAAGFFDLAGNSGTGNLGGFRSSCTNNLIAANGVLNAPDYTRTCSCSYQNQTSLALVHMPEAEFWTFGGVPAPERIGINFGAPGDRRSPEGTLFTEFPSVGGESEEVEVEVDGDDEGDKTVFRRVHSAMMKEDGLPWIGASVADGVEKIEIELPGTVDRSDRCRLRLYFSEPNEFEIGERVFDVVVQDETVIERLDIAKEAGARRTLVRELEGVPCEKKIKIRLVPRTKHRGSIAGVEILFSDG